MVRVCMRTHLLLCVHVATLKRQLRLAWHWRPGAPPGPDTHGACPLHVGGAAAGERLRAGARAPRCVRVWQYLMHNAEASLARANLILLVR